MQQFARIIKVGWLCKVYVNNNPSPEKQGSYQTCIDYVRGQRYKLLKD